MEDESAIREKKIMAILGQELDDGENLAAEARKAVEYLLLEKKGYAREEVRNQVVFEVILGQETAHSSVDFLVSIEGKKAMVIKCSSGSLSSRERQAVAAARLLAHGFGVGAVGVDSDGAGDGDRIAAADSATVAHDRLPL